MRPGSSVPLACVAALALLAACNDSITPPDQSLPTAPNRGLVLEMPTVCSPSTEAPLVADGNVVVGSVRIANDHQNLYVKYTTSAEWPIRKTALAVAASVNDIPTSGGGNPQVGRFPYSDRHAPGTMEVIWAVPLAEIGGSTAIVAAFAEVGAKSEGAWGAGEPITAGGSWASYISHPIALCATQTIGPAGGQISFQNLVLEFPAGALTQEEAITVQQIPLSEVDVGQTTTESNARPTSNVTGHAQQLDLTTSGALAINGVFLLEGTAYRLGPEGLQFQESVKITIGYEQNDIPSGVPERLLRVFAINGVFFDPGPDPELVDEVNDRVSTFTTHFSEFVVGGPSHVADLQITMTRAPEPVAVDADLVHTLTVTNHGPDDVTDVRVGLVVDGDVDIKSPNQEGCTDLFSTTPPRKLMVDCPAGDLASGESAVLTLTVVPNVAGATLTSTARVDDFDGAEDPDESNNEVVEETTVEAGVLSAELEITSFTLTPNPVVAGDPLTHTFTVRNNGPMDASPINLSLRSIGTLAFPALHPDCHTKVQEADGKGFNCTIASLPSGQSQTLVVDLIPQTAEETIESSIRISSSNRPDPDLTNNERTASADVVASLFTGQVVFVSSRDGSPDVYVKDLSTGVVNQITNNNDDKGRPSWSPDGSRIVFSRQTNPPIGASNLWMMNANGTGLTQLTTTGTAGVNPRWSPNGLEIVYHDSNDGDWEIYVLEVANPANRRKLTNNTTQELEPDWSPNGTTIVYTRTGSFGNHELRTMSAADGSGDALLLAGTVRLPRWSPDGSKVAYERQGAAGVRDIEVIEVATSQVSVVVSDGTANSGPAWSPGGTYIIFAKNGLDPNLSDDVFDLWIVPVDGSGAAVLIEASAADDTGPDWKTGS